jgi:uncharacterized protein (UPF0333 family)
MYTNKNQLSLTYSLISPHLLLNVAKLLHLSGSCENVQHGVTCVAVKAAVDSYYKSAHYILNALNFQQQQQQQHMFSHYAGLNRQSYTACKLSQ